MHNVGLMSGFFGFCLGYHCHDLFNGWLSGDEDNVKTLGMSVRKISNFTRSSRYSSTSKVFASGVTPPKPSLLYYIELFNEILESLVVLYSS